MSLHPTQWQQLQSAVLNQRTPQSMLFVGPLHCDLSGFTIQITQLILCQNRHNEACKECLDCRMVAQAEHPDLLWVKPEKTGGAIKIEQVRALQHEAYLTPQRSDYRVIIIEAADKMNTASANALLKILEEPSRHTIFMLLAQQLGTVLPTVLSRCHIVRFSSAEDYLVSNMLLLAQHYPKDSDRVHIINESEVLLEGLIAIVQRKQHPCTVAASWAKYEINTMIWFLYLVFAQLLTMHANNKQATGPAFSQLNRLASLMDPILIFKQIDKINSLLRKLSHNITVNYTLALEDLLITCSTIN